MSIAKNIDFELLGRLLHSAQQGEKDAYRQFLETISGYVNAIVSSRIGAAADVEDIVQNVLMGIHVSLHTYDSSKRVKPWVNAIIHYKVVDYFRAQSRRKEFTAGENIDVTYPAQESNSDTGDTRLKEDDAWSLVEMLPDGMREAVMLTKREGLSTKEAAEKLGLTEVALRKRASRAYDRLAKLYEKKYGKADE